MITKSIALFITFVLAMALSYESKGSQTLIENGRSDYKIILSEKASAIDIQAGSVLQKYLQQISGVLIPVINDQSPHSKFEIQIGKTNRTNNTLSNNLDKDGISISVSGTEVRISGGSDKGVLYSVYSFLEKFLGCRKFAAGYSVVPKNSIVTIPSDISIIENPDFDYREVYYPESADQEYLDWHKLQRLDESWGLWVHTFDKLVPARDHFNSHPEYYGLVNGERKPSQLCLTNPEVFRILTTKLQNMIADDPTKKYWSVSQNDDLGYCECDKCKEIDDREGGPQGSILQFVNKVAGMFPDKTISTLAYTYSQKAPLTLKPAKNVNIMLCSINCNRSKPIEIEPRSASFSKDVRDWSSLTNNLFIWDYVVQFTNYISPFPNIHVLKPNVQFFKKSGVSGIFEQGSGDTGGEFSELKSYLLAKLLWDSEANADSLKNDFISNYYGKGAPFISTYIDLLEKNSKQSGRILDIYGGPVKEYNSFLKPDHIEQYGILFDQAEAAVENNPTYLKHVRTARLAVEYTVLQQSKFYGIEKHGVFSQNKQDDWIARPSFQQKVNQFVQTANSVGIKLLSEVGRTPNQYKQEWDGIFKAGPKIHSANNSNIIPGIPHSLEYPNKGLRTLTDGSSGYADFSYNWLGWYGDNVEVILDLGTKLTINQLSVSFLEDQRHWAFLPSKVEFEISIDGNKYVSLGSIAGPPLDEIYEVSIKDYTSKLSEPKKARYIKLKANNLETLPPWRYYKNRKGWLFADEIMVN